MADSHIVQTRHSISSSTRLAVQIDRRVPRAVASAPRSWRPTPPTSSSADFRFLDVLEKSVRKIGNGAGPRGQDVYSIGWLQRAHSKINGDGAFFRDGRCRRTTPFYKPSPQRFYHIPTALHYEEAGDHTARHQPSRAIADCQQLPVSVKHLACTEPIHLARRGRLNGAPRGSRSSVQNNE